MSDELWNAKLTRENISDFYYQTVVMVFSSVYPITKEATRCERAIVKSYLDIYSRRNTVPAEQVIFVFGDLLLENAKSVVEEFPLPADVTFQDRLLDEYTRNSMLEKILSKIDSKSFKMAEFISTDVKKNKVPKAKSGAGLFVLTPLLVIEIIVLAVIIAVVSYAAITVPYTSDKLIDERGIFEAVSVQEQFVGAMDYYPLNVNVTKSAYYNDTMQQACPSDEITESGEVAPSDTQGVLAPSLAEPTDTQVSATSG
ncbi:MAG: hypothetical protein K5745_01700 [Saccharofermentans sp.]|nr:hypothetical protein [Saccharofermentans sp.]